MQITAVKAFELEEQLFQQEAVEQELRQAHVAELAEVQQKMRGQLEEEKHILLKQIRELTRLKEEAHTKVCIYMYMDSTCRDVWEYKLQVRPVENGWIEIC